MTLLQPKCKTISFRLSEVEYAAAERLFRDLGYRSVSLFARSAVLAFQHSAVNGAPSEIQIHEICGRLEFIMLELRKIKEMVTKSDL
jgi:hypothetical protein